MKGAVRHQAGLGYTQKIRCSCDKWSPGIFWAGTALAFSVPIKETNETYFVFHKRLRIFRIETVEKCGE
jgi:hypothetical protein